MTQPTDPQQYPLYPAPPPSVPPPAKPARRKPRRWPWIVGLVAALLLGVGLGGGTAASTAPDVVSAPAPTVTVTQSPAVKVPEVCLDALDSADELTQIAGKGFGIAADVMGAAQDGFMAAAEMDIPAMEKAAEDLGKHSRRLTQLREDQLDPAISSYVAERDECRDHA